MCAQISDLQILFYCVLIYIALKSVLKPPKLAPSAWQLYFTDWIQRQQASGTRKLNVAQAAKEAGQEYASLSTEQKEVSAFFPYLYDVRTYAPLHCPLLIAL